MSSPNATRWLALHLPRLATDAQIRAGCAPSDQPFALYAKAANAFALIGVNAPALKRGLRVGMVLADAHAIYPALVVAEHNERETAQALDAIAAWCERFTPVVVLDAPDGLFLDITGCAHLFGGEAELHATLCAKLNAQGFTIRAAIAPTPGCAWALAHYAPPLPRGHRAASGPELFDSPIAKRSEGAGGEGRPELSAQGANEPAPSATAAPHSDRPSPPNPLSARERGSLARLPVQALRLEENSAALLKRLGLKTIGQLAAAPRASFAARAGEHALLRLDQALGRAPEALTPRRPAPPVYAARRLLEPVFSVETLMQVAAALIDDTLKQLDIRGAGARRAALHLFGVDGGDRRIEIGLSRPERDPKAMLRLLSEKLSLAGETLDMEFGIESARLDIVALERLDPTAQTLVAESDAASDEKIAAIIDLVSARLGRTAVLKPLLRDAHAPERAGAWHAALEPAVQLKSAVHPEDGVMRRPLSLFLRAQAIEVIAEVPDGPPTRFRWRRVMREITRAEGPERIAGDWLKGEPTRDYYRAEDREGRRYWLFREGLYGEAQAPRWFMHGLFA